MGIDVIDRLGTDLERVWRSADYDPRHFPDAAAKALTEADLPSRLHADDVVDWVFGAAALPRQESLPATFGQPPVTLFRTGRFYIEALYWVDGSTTIHQHGFSGAFQVLSGSSIETRYSFETVRAVDGHFAMGTLAVLSTALLRKGDIRPIVPGIGGLVHSLFHLERPSVTIVVRTFGDAGVGPQFRYAWPGVALNPFFKEETADRTLELVRLLLQIDHPSLEAKVGQLVARLDLHGAYRVLAECSHRGDKALLDRLLGRLRDPSASGLFRAAFEESRRLAFLASRRALVKDLDLRFFLGVLLNARRRVDALALIHARAPGSDPAARAASWLRQLASTSLKLQAGGASWQPNVLGLPEMSEAHERALCDALSGKPPADDADPRLLEALRQIPALAGLFAG
jgi:hypothetical protein